MAVIRRPPPPTKRPGTRQRSADGSLEMHVLKSEQMTAPQALQVEPQGPGVLHQVLGGFLERQEDAGFAVLEGAADQEFHGEQRLATPGAAAHQGGPAARQSAASHLVQSRDSGGGFCEGPIG